MSERPRNLSNAASNGFFDEPADRLDADEATNVSERVSFVVRLPNGRRLVREARAMTITEAEFLAAIK